MKRSTFAGLVAGATFGAPAFLRAASAAEAITCGVVNTSSDVTLFCADKLGFFKDEGLDVRFVAFDSAAKMVAPLGAGQLDVAAGAPSAGLYNAVLRGVDVRIVADKGSAPPGYGFLPLLVRSDLAKSGRVKTFADLKGLKYAEPAQGTSTASTVNEALKKGGLRYTDVQHVYLGFPDHVPAFRNGSIDVAETVEPVATLAVNQGVAVKLATDDTWYPYQQIAVLLYGGQWIEKRRDLAERFMAAYIRGARYYQDSLSGGKIRGKNASTVLDFLVAETPLKNRAVYEQATPNGNDPNGRLNVESLRRDLAFFREQGWVTGNIELDRVLNLTFVEAAVKRLGPYRPTHG
jgi:NitT/TauT family transport system substrate-binding protein